MKYSENYKRFLNRLGYYSYQEGLIHRYAGQEEGWKSHLENCRNFILKAIDLNKPEKVTVLGSGWLLDFPLAEIAEMNIQVALVDIVHPPDVIKQVTPLKNVEVIEDDVTGGLVHEIWKKTTSIPVFHKLSTLDDIKIPRFRFNGNPGMVISLNILSQLDQLVVKYIRRKSRIGEPEFQYFRSEIQRKHVELLTHYNSVLISDIEEIFTGRSGESTVVKTVFTELPAGRTREAWRWDFDLKKSDYYQKSSVLNVVAIMI
jgi:hypothetical protein